MREEKESNWFFFVLGERARAGMSGSFYVEESGMGKSSERPNLVDSNAGGDFREET